MASAAAEFARLVEIMATLRSPAGCPWDRQQTIDTLKPFVLEETYEVLEAIDRHDHEALREELGELREVASAAPPDQARAEEEMGDLLFAIANLSRKLGIEPETALRKANEKFTKRFETMERAIAASGRTMRGLKLDELEREWQ